MGELKFNNLTVLYNKDDFSKKSLRKYRLLEKIVGTIFAIIIMLLIAIIAQLKFTITNIIISIIVIIVLMTLIVLTCTSIENKYKPKNYNLIQSIKNKKSDDIEVGWFNGRYIALTYNENHGWQVYGLKRFLHGKDYVLTDNANKDKPIHMTIDTTKEVIEITIENINE